MSSACLRRVENVNSSFTFISTSNHIRLNNNSDMYFPVLEVANRDKTSVSVTCYCLSEWMYAIIQRESTCFYCLLFPWTWSCLPGLSFFTHLSSSRLRLISSSSSLWIQVPSLLIFSKCFFTSSLHSACNMNGKCWQSPVPFMLWLRNQVLS